MTQTLLIRGGTLATLGPKNRLLHEHGILITDGVIKSVMDTYLKDGIPFYPNPSAKEVQEMAVEEADRVMAQMIRQPDTRAEGVKAFESYLQKGDQDGV